MSTVTGAVLVPSLPPRRRFRRHRQHSLRWLVGSSRSVSMFAVFASFGRGKQGLVDMSAMALNAAMSGSILAYPEACFVMIMALPFDTVTSY